MDRKTKEVGGKFSVNGKIFPIYGGVNPIGRNKEAVVNIKSLGVSQQHALFILIDDDLHFISDLKSSNGTFLDSEKIDPLQLYRLQNGSRVKFADIEGVYSKLTSVDMENQGKLLNSSENTQNFTQNFYGSDTQIIDNTISVNQHDKSAVMKNYISSQILAEVAEEMENAYIRTHEQPTQVVLTGIDGVATIPEMTNFSTHPNEKKIEGIISSKTGFTFHEDQTQIIDDQEIEEKHSFSNEISSSSIIALHEAETQIVFDPECEILQKIGETTQSSKVNSSEDNTHLIVDQEIEKVVSPNEDTSNNLHNLDLQEKENNIDFNMKDMSNQKIEDEASKMCIISDSDVKTSQVITQDNDIVNPLGISNNILRDTQSLLSGTHLESLDDSDIIRPVKKSINIFTSQDSTVEEFKEDNQKSDGLVSHDSLNSSSNKLGCSYTAKLSLDDSESDIIRPVKKSINIFDSEENEDSNDSLDFMTMQKITNTERYIDAKEDSLINKRYTSSEKTDNIISNNTTTDGFDVGLDDEEFVQKSDHLDDGSETENENLEEKTENEIDKQQNKRSTLKIKQMLLPQTTNSETEDELNSDEKIKGTKKKTKRMKERNSIPDSDSETDAELEKKEKLLVKVVCSDSDTDIENNEYPIDKERNSGIDNLNEKNNESVGLVLEESALEEDPIISEKTDNNEDTHSNINSHNRLSVGNNELLNDSDFIPPTQENNLRTISQNSKLENSENSFKLGLTQLMDEDDTSQQNILNPTPHNSASNKDEIANENEKHSESKNSQDTQKKFVFKKSSSGITKSVDITLDYEEDIYQVNTQNILEEKCPKRNNSTEDHVFLQPTQEAPKKIKQNKEESISDEDFYLLSTQRLDGSSKQNDIDDFYQQSTQKLIVEESVEQNIKNNLRHSGNEFYQMPTQKLPEDGKLDNVNKDAGGNDSKDDDDIFATQVMDVKDSPHKYLESELEHMFATQRAIPTEDTLDKIQDIVLKKQIVDDKLPTEDKDLEAILATQRMLDSPKTPKKNEAIHHTAKSIESQLEVLFASQTSNLPPDKFVRPINPLVNIFGDTQDTQELLNENSSPDKEKKNVEHDESENTITRQKKTCQIGLEQSFALLEAKSTKIRRSDRNKNCEEVSVSCSKTRVSMIVAPNDKKILEEEPKPIQVKNVRTSRKRQPPTVLESKKTDVKVPEKRKRRRLSETTNSSDEENQSNIRLGSSKQNITNKILSRIQEIEDGEDVKSSVKIIERPETPNRHRSSRKEKVKTEENKESTKDEYVKSYRTRITKINKTSDPSTSKNSSQDRDSVKYEYTRTESSNSNEENNDSVDKNNKKGTDFEAKSSRTRGSKLSKKSDSNNVDFKVEEKEAMDKKDTEIKKKDIKENKTSRTRTSRVTKITVLDEEPLTVQDTESSKNVVKTNEGSGYSCESKKVNRNGEIENNVKKLKDNVQTLATPSRTSKRGCSIQVTTPPKIQRISEATPTSSRRRINLDTPNRTKRKLKPKVIFTMMDDPQLESQIKQLGGSVVDSIDDCTVLITKFVKRTMKLLSAVGLGKPICSEEWVKQSIKENDFLDPWDFVLVDNEAEKKWCFSLKTSLERSIQTKLFEGYTFQLLVTNAQDVLKGAIESCGGKIVTRIPKVAKNLVIVAVPEQKDRYKKLLKQNSNLIVVEPEAIFDGVLRQEIRFTKHLLK